jgi:WD40 repeat protein
LRPLGTHTDVVKSVEFTPDGRLAVSASNDRAVVLWDVQAGRKVRTFRGHTGDINCVALAPSGEVAVTGGWDKTLRIWELATGRELQCCGGAFSAFQWSVFMCLAFHPDGHLLAGSSDHSLCLIDLTTGSVTRRFEGHANWVSSVALSADGSRAVSGSWDGTVRLWDVASGKQLACFEGHTDQVLAVAFAPDGQHAFSGGADNAILVWRVAP